MLLNCHCFLNLIVFGLFILESRDWFYKYCHLLLHQFVIFSLTLGLRLFWRLNVHILVLHALVTNFNTGLGVLFTCTALHGETFHCHLIERCRQTKSVSSLVILQLVNLLNAIAFRRRVYLQVCLLLRSLLSYHFNWLCNMLLGDYGPTPSTR